MIFIPITAVLPSRLSLLPPLPRENISVCPYYRGITADYRSITVVPITVQLFSLDYMTNRSVHYYCTVAIIRHI